MRATLLVAGHHARRLLRNPALVLILLAIPVSLAAIEYAAFGRTVASGKLPPITVLLLDEDQSLVSRLVPQLFAAGPMRGQFQVETVTNWTSVRARFQANDASALVVIPKGFQERALAGTRTELAIYKNPLQSILPGVVEGVLDVGAMIGNQLLEEARGPLNRIRHLVEAGSEGSDQDMLEIARGLAAAGRRFGSLASLDRATVRVERPGTGLSAEQMNTAQFFAVVFPGLAIFVLLFISQALAARLLRDRMRGLPRRLATLPVSRDAIVWGGILYVAATLLVLLIVLGGIGRLVFGISLRNPLSLVVVGAGFAAFAGGLHLAIAGVARSDRTAAFVGTAVVLVISLLGGSFVPLDLYPASIRPLATLVPNGAAQQAIVDVLRGRGLADIVGLVATTWFWGALAIGLAAYLEHRRFTLS
jgi:ABC-type multidrug transport system permease subunit